MLENMTACSCKVCSFSSPVFCIHNSTFRNELFQELTNTVEIDKFNKNKMILMEWSPLCLWNVQKQIIYYPLSTVTFLYKDTVILDCILPYCKILY
jgi:hypothetical protein